MKDSFQGTKTILLQPASDSVPYTFTFPVNSSATANDGAIPFLDTIASAVVKAFSEAGTDVTTEIVEGSSETTTVVTVELTYPPTSKQGRYSLEFVLTLASGAVMEFDFTRVYALDVAA